MDEEAFPAGKLVSSMARRESNFWAGNWRAIPKSRTSAMVPDLKNVNF